MILMLILSLTIMALGDIAQHTSYSCSTSNCDRSVDVLIKLGPDNNTHILELDFNEKLSTGSTINISLQKLDVEQRKFSKLHLMSHKIVNVQISKPERNITLLLSFPDKRVPKIISLSINNEERCFKLCSEIEKPENKEFNDDFIVNSQTYIVMQAVSSLNDNMNCGMPITKETDKFKNTVTTNPGDWPWHTVIMRRINAVVRYICGGTLISRTLVLTAAHCVTVNGVPMNTSSLTVTLGKYKLDRGDTINIDKKVSNVIIHPLYDFDYGHNDIAILTLTKAAEYGTKVQAACVLGLQDLSKISASRVVGRVVGWGIKHKNSLSRTLYTAPLTKVSENDCIESNSFFSTKMNGFNFCAGLKKGSSACNGDSGGGYFVFVPDGTEATSKNAVGKWYIHGVSSGAVAIEDETNCDPRNNLLFTDVVKFADWIEQYLYPNNNKAGLI